VLRTGKLVQICFYFPKLGGISAIEVNFMAFDLLKFSRPQGGNNSSK